MSKQWRVALGLLALAVLVLPTSALAGDAYIKGGVVLGGNNGAFTNRWFISTPPVRVVVLDGQLTFRVLAGSRAFVPAVQWFSGISHVESWSFSATLPSFIPFVSSFVSAEIGGERTGISCGLPDPVVRDSPTPLTPKFSRACRVSAERLMFGDRTRCSTAPSSVGWERGGAL